MQTQQRQQLQTNLLLLLIALIWGFGFVAQRLGMEHVGPYTFNGLRFMLGGLCLLPLAKRKGKANVVLVGKRISSLQAGLWAGAVLFIAASLQQLGLQYTTAGKAGFITGLYVVFVPLLGLCWGQKTELGAWLGAVLAVIGLYFLSIEHGLQLAHGDLLETIGALFWALHVVLLGFLSPRTEPLRLAMMQFFVCGLASLAIGLMTEPLSMRALAAALPAIGYGGFFSVGAGYTLQVVAQRKAQPAQAAILLSLESPFAALGGWLLLDEQMRARALFGCALMLAAMLLSQLWPLERRRGQAS